MSLIEQLPADWRSARLLGRLLTREGPTPILVNEGRVRDVSRVAPTVAQFLEEWNGEVPPGEDLGPLEQLPLAPAFGNAGRGAAAAGAHRPSMHQGGGRHVRGVGHRASHRRARARRCRARREPCARTCAIGSVRTSAT